MFIRDVYALLPQGFCMKILTEQELIALAEAGSKADETLSNIR